MALLPQFLAAPANHQCKPVQEIDPLLICDRRKTVRLQPD
jgi:hypothetical protein